MKWNQGDNGMVAGRAVRCDDKDSSMSRGGMLHRWSLVLCIAGSGYRRRVEGFRLSVVVVTCIPDGFRRFRGGRLVG
jgi:hypothetical protein